MARRRVRVVRHPRAIQDIIDTADYIAQDSLPAARRFLRAVEASIERLASMPGMGSPYHADDPGLAGTRMLRVRGFARYLVFYRTVGNDLVVMRVIHGARDIPILLSEVSRDLGEEDAEAP
jgi:toxin ParE1/3/4